MECRDKAGLEKRMKVSFAEENVAESASATKSTLPLALGSIYYRVGEAYSLPEDIAPIP
jgi:hypothetical protein